MPISRGAINRLPETRRSRVIEAPSAPIDTYQPLPYTGAFDPYVVQWTLSAPPCQPDQCGEDAVCLEWRSI
jgi:hypothetical protein